MSKPNRVGSTAMTSAGSSQILEIDSYQNNQNNGNNKNHNMQSPSTIQLNSSNYNNNRFSNINNNQFIDTSSRDHLDLPYYYDENAERIEDIKKGIALNLFNLCSVLTVISASFVGFTQLISIIYKLDVLLFDETIHTPINLLRIVLQIYDILFCIYICLVEMDFDLLKESFIIQNWVARGIFYTFVSLLTFDDKDNTALWKPVLEMSGISLLLMGFIYLLMVCID